ncbi:hypothetical protein NC652_041738 [Populus alba x Populus x berolinensis]|nr:hypothetical protein NC652_041738 [Populus alba x Populus x berolinensis]
MYEHRGSDRSMPLRAHNPWRFSHQSISCCRMTLGIKDFRKSSNIVTDELVFIEMVKEQVPSKVAFEKVASLTGPPRLDGDLQTQFMHMSIRFDNKSLPFTTVSIEELSLGGLDRASRPISNQSPSQSFSAAAAADAVNHKAVMADESIDVKDEVAELAPFDPTKKKKKKKVVIQDNADEAVDSLADKTESLSVSDGLESSFTGLKKKKKKPVETSMLDEESGDAGEDLDGEDENGEGADLQQQQRNPWDGTDRDYEYEELLGRVFNILRENNPELAGDRRRTVMRPPQVLREGTKKTVFVNFMDLCRTMHRQADHVMAFLLAELGTSGSLDGQQRLVVKGRFAPKNFEGILRRYISKYITFSIDSLYAKLSRRN